MDSIVVKTEMQSNGEILLFYIDENGGNEEGVLTTVESIENQAIQLQQDNNSFIIPDVGEVPTEVHIDQPAPQRDIWTEDEIKRLLVFYNDNKQTFISGTTKKQHLWTVACKTMIVGKTPTSCEARLSSLKKKYFEICGHMQKGIYVKWPYFELCHQIFQEDSPDITVEPLQTSNEPQIMKVPALKQNYDSVMVVKKVNTRSNIDEKVETMLNLYLKYKQNFQQEYWRRGLWETIAMEIGEDDGEYWQKRFLNYKQHYLRLIDKRRMSGSDGINWPYMELFDKIFEGDEDFQRKYLNEDYRPAESAAVPENKVIYKVEDWDTTETTVLVKYCFDCFDEFEDRTIPNSFLWNEIGRLLDKTADACKKKFEELKSEHLDKYIEGGYCLRNRKPTAILFDNIISKEIENQMRKSDNKAEQLELWKTEELDEMVQFFYDNIEMYKDLTCHFVCWAGVCKKLKRKLENCRSQWEDLLNLYKTILNDKKENPDMQIDWRYIEVFDRIFDYGMDTNLLEGYNTIKSYGQKEKSETGKIGVKKVNIKMDDSIEDFTDDEESVDERGFTKRTKRRSGDSKAFKILEYYQKNKDKFSTTNRNKHTLWEVLAKQIGISATQCAHRFRNLKQVYTAYVQREINKPEMPILWPYYTLCKKVFGYRAIKSKLKNGKLDSDDSEDWSAKEIKQLINYFSQNFHDINSNVDDNSKWSELAGETGKSETSCKEKFLELRKSYRKLKTMRSRNPDVKISWKYFNMFEQIYNAKEDSQEKMEVDTNEKSYADIPMGSDDKMDQEEDDYQCIIVIPEGQDISNIENAQIIIQEQPAISQETDMQEPTDNQELEHNQEPPENLEATDNQEPPNNLQHAEYQVITENQELMGNQEPIDNLEHIVYQEPTDNQELIYHQEPSEYLAHNQEPMDNQDPAVYQAVTDNQEVVEIPEVLQNPESTDNQKQIPLVKWTKRTKKRLLIFYINYIRANKGNEINAKKMWIEIASKLPHKTPLSCRKMFAKLKANHKRTDELVPNVKESPYFSLIEKVMRLKPTFTKTEQSKTLKDGKIYKDVALPEVKVDQALKYYLENIEDFVSPRFEKKYLWTELANCVTEPITKVFNKINYLKQAFNSNTDQVAGEETPFADLLQSILAKETAIKLVLESSPKPVIEELVNEETWTDDETEKLLQWYLSNLEKFKNPKFVRSYLWMEVSGMLNKSAITCSKKMSEIRTQYRNMVRETPEELNNWRFLDLCQKIYGTGRKGTPLTTN